MDGSDPSENLLWQAEAVAKYMRDSGRMLRSLAASETQPRLGRLTGQQATALKVLVAKGGGLRIAALARQLGVAQSTASGLVDRLEQHGLAIRMPDHKDRRSVQVVPTWKVRRLLEDRPDHETYVPLARVLSPATTEERAQMLAGLGALHHLLIAHDDQLVRMGRRSLRRP